MVYKNNSAQFLWMTASLLLASCTSLKFSDLHGETHRYFGFVKIESPLTEKSIEAVSVSALGLSVGKNLVLGWTDSDQVVIPLRIPESGSMPYEATCAMVLIVKTESQARNARETLENLKGENVCVTTFHK